MNNNTISLYLQPILPEAFILPLRNHRTYPFVMSQSETLSNRWCQTRRDSANLPQNKSGCSKLNLRRSSWDFIFGMSANSGNGVVDTALTLCRTSMWCCRRRLGSRLEHVTNADDIFITTRAEPMMVVAQITSSPE